MRLILAKGFDSEALEDISSHSLKATLLSYMNKWGCSLETSELLGYHVNKEHQSALNYTRDCLSAPMREMVTMMTQIYHGSFVPGAPRDEAFPPVTSQMPIARFFLHETGLNVLDAARVMQEDAVFSSKSALDQANSRLQLLTAESEIPGGGIMIHLTPDGDMALRGVNGDPSGSSDSSDSSSQSSSDADEEVEAGHVVIDAVHERDRMTLPSENADTMTLFRHGRTRMLHYGHVSSSEKTGCGRLLSEAYYEFKTDPDKAFPKCKVCFGSVQV